MADVCVYVFGVFLFFKKGKVWAIGQSGCEEEACVQRKSQIQTMKRDTITTKLTRFGRGICAGLK